MECGRLVTWKIITKHSELRQPERICNLTTPNKWDQFSTKNTRKQESTMGGRKFCKDHPSSSSAVRISKLYTDKVEEKRDDGTSIVMISNETPSVNAFTAHVEGRNLKLFDPSKMIGAVEKVHLWTVKDHKEGSKTITANDLIPTMKALICLRRRTIKHLSFDGTNVTWESISHAVVSIPNFKRLSLIGGAAVVNVPWKVNGRGHGGKPDYLPGKIPADHVLRQLFFDGCTFEQAGKLIEALYYGLKPNLRPQFKVTIRNPQRVAGPADLAAIKWMVQYFEEDDAANHNEKAIKSGEPREHFYHLTAPTFNVDFWTSYKKSKKNTKKLQENREQYDKVLQELEVVMKPVKNYFEDNTCKSRLTKLLVEHEKFGLDNLYGIMNQNAQGVVDVLKEGDFEKAKCEGKSKATDEKNNKKPPHAKKREVKNPWKPGRIMEVKRIKFTIND